MVVFPKASTK